MLTLLLLRHAKAVPHGHGDDFARVLAERGHAEATRLGRFLDEKGLWPDLALVSPSARTRETFEGLVGVANRPLQARSEAKLYNASATQIRDMLRLVDPAVRTLMVVGHNPGIQEAAALLTREADPSDVQRLRNRFPPCALAMLAFETTHWADARASGGRLDLVLLPEDLADLD